VADKETETVQGQCESGLMGAVMVVGAGIAGLQSASDLADSGYLVHLLTGSPSAGGPCRRCGGCLGTPGEIQPLDRTFPTNECSMCLLWPRTMDVVNHPSVSLHAMSSVERVEGEPGNFKISVRKRPRYVDAGKCTACGDCEVVCPVQVSRRPYEGGGLHKAIYRVFPQAVPNKYLIEKRGEPPCRNSCPAGCNVPGFVALASQGKFQEALEVARRRMPLAGVCGRICHHPCEDSCNRGEYDQPLAIAGIERAVADLGWSEEGAVTAHSVASSRSERVAIIGAGPAGLTAAQDLAQEGIGVAVFEAKDAAGGMMRASIPRYRLPLDVVQRETGRMLQAGGIEFRPNTKIGRDMPWEHLREDYQAILVATGLPESRMLDIPGAGLPGVVPALALLGSANAGHPMQVGAKVLVVGGSRLAVDAARTALRLGAVEVHLICRESRAEMIARGWGIEYALEEGVMLLDSWEPRQFLGEGHVTGVELKRCGAFDAADASCRSGPNDPATRVVGGDMVVVAVGQAGDLSFLPVDGSVESTPNGGLAADPLTLVTSMPGVFAAGDVATGPKSVVEAVASGHEAAVSILRYLDGADLESGRRQPPSAAVGPPEENPVTRLPRVRPPVSSPDELRPGFDEISQSYTPEQAMAEASRCLNCGVCSDCGQCVVACNRECIDLNEQEEVVELEAGAVVLAPGYDVWDARDAGEYGHGIYENVLTSLEFERVLAYTGPTCGLVQRPSDGQVPLRVAFIQCVGSRDCARDGNEYCSSMCCMYATKEAVIARERDRRIETTIFYLDVRSHAKDADRYVDLAKTSGVRYLRTMVTSLMEDPLTKNLTLRYLSDGHIVTEEFDLVVLSVGSTPPPAAQELADVFRVELDQYGFARTDSLDNTLSTRPGVFVAGAFQGPLEIPETVVSGSAAAAGAGGLLATARGKLVQGKRYPPERDVRQEDPRVGVFICDCGVSLGSVVDVPEVIAHVRALPGVIHAEENRYLCSQDAVGRVKDVVLQKGLNRVVVASCAVRSDEPLFQEALKEAGLNPFYLEMVNLRDGDSWVHQCRPKQATEKAQDLIRGAVAKVELHQPLCLTPSPSVPKALIVGGGIAGMTAALAVVEQGFQAYIVERDAQLGGQAAKLRRSLDGTDLQLFVRETIGRVLAHPNIAVLTGARVRSFEGHQGHFATTISVVSRGGSVEEKLEHGVFIIATGTKEHVPDKYLLGVDDRVLTNTQMEERLFDGQWDGSAIKQVVFVQCVGSRDVLRPYCSRTCCAQTVKNAIQMKKLVPGVEVFVLYRDVRTYGLMERYYRHARELGVVFVRYEPEREPTFRHQGVGSLEVVVYDEVAQRDIVLSPDQLVLATGAEAPDGIHVLGTTLRLPLNEDGFFMEAHAKLSPLDFPAAGFYLCGSGHAPKTVAEVVSQARGAAARAATVLSKSSLIAGGVVCTVDPDLCAFCLTCVRVCPYGVPRINEYFKADIDPLQCRGCGTCAAECPAKAIQLLNYKDDQMLAKVAGIMGKVR
jgi:heterodisulfide reductase subunit A-like polyferredoxin